MSNILPAAKENYAERGVKLMLNSLITSVEKEELRITIETYGRKGVSKRKSYDFHFKMNVIDELDCDAPAVGVTFNKGIDQSLVFKWNKERKTIIDGAASKHRKLLKKNRRSNKHNYLYSKLIKKFRDSSCKGMMVSFSWLYTHTC